MHHLQYRLVLSDIDNLRYERTQLAKAFFISEQEVRAKIARVAMPMYQKVVERSPVCALLAISLA